VCSGVNSFDAGQTIDELATTEAGAVDCSGGGLGLPVGPADIHARRLTAPRALRALPAWAMVTGRAPSSSTRASTATSSGSCAATTCASHGAPRTCTGTCPSHLHISWASGCYGSSGRSAACECVAAFAHTADEAAAA